MSATPAESAQYGHCCTSPRGLCRVTDCVSGYVVLDSGVCSIGSKPRWHDRSSMQVDSPDVRRCSSDTRRSKDPTGPAPSRAASHRRAIARTPSPAGEPGRPVRNAGRIYRSCFGGTGREQSCDQHGEREACRKRILSHGAVGPTWTCSFARPKKRDFRR